MESRSPSPNPSRPKTPDTAGVRRSTGSIIPSKPTESPSRPRTPDNTAVRRSTGSLNPSRPTAPADSSRNSGYKASRDLLPSLRASEQNENDKEPNSLKTPRAASKGVKSFMAPTISASSKVIAASPRKKILGERNEVVPESESLVLGSPQPGFVQDHHGVEEIRKKSEVSSGFWDVLGSPDARTPDLDSKSYKHAATPSFTPTPAPSPVDADPSSLPYDPKTNPLAPRPQFLYYKPSPWVEHGGEEDGKQQESFSSESYEEIDDGSEEAVSELQQNEPEEGMKLEDTFQEDERTEEAVSVLQRELEESADSTDSVHDSLKPSGKHRKSRLFTWFKAIPLIFIMVMACLYAPLWVPPALSPSPSFILENLNGAASRLREWSTSSLAHLTVPSLPKEFDPYDLVNLTFSSMDQTVDSDSIFTTPKLDQAHLITETDQAVQGVEVSVENGIEDVVVHGDVGEEARPVENENEEKCVEELELNSSPLGHDAAPDTEEQITLEVPKEEEYNSVEEGFEEEANSLEIVTVSENDAAPETEEQIMLEEHREEKFPSVENYEDSVKDLGQDDTSTIEEIVEEHKDTSLSLAISSETFHDQDTQIQLGGFVDSLLGGSDRLSARSVLGLSVAVIVLASTLAILYMKKKQSFVVEHKVLPTEAEVSASASSDNFDNAEKSTYQKNVIGDLGPSEANSYLQGTPCSGQEKRDNGVDSLSNDDRRLRRDSTISSSISYGSYTTLERISAKKGYRDDEVVTPVRRSSRIRSKVASPSVEVEP